jgi:hypothetical protein
MQRRGQFAAGLGTFVTAVVLIAALAATASARDGYSYLRPDPQ